MPDSQGLSRRNFIQSSIATAGVAALSGPWAAAADDTAAAKRAPRGERPVVISSANGIKAIETAQRRMAEGDDVLNAVILAVNIVEDDPEDHSVGLGGLPNEDGVVELDSSVMFGPTHKAGAVASIRNIRNPSKVARLVMERTDHVLIVGEGALRFAKAHGFKEEDLLTDDTRKIWLEWKESHSAEDDWLSPKEATSRKSAALKQWMKTYGTINCCAVNAAGDIAGVTTTSGLSYKIPGRVGDSPIIGAGLYVDNAVGAAGSTGRGEANLQNCSSFMIVEFMRNGQAPEEACLAALKRVAEHTEPRLRDDRGRPSYDLKFYAIAKDGRYGSASMWSGGKYAVHDGSAAQLRDCAFLYERNGFQPE